MDESNITNKVVTIGLSGIPVRTHGIEKDEFSYRLDGVDDDGTYERHGVAALAALKRICALPQISERGLDGFEFSIRMSGRDTMRYCSISVFESCEPEFLSLAFDLEGSWMAVAVGERGGEFCAESLDGLIGKLEKAHFRFRAPLGWRGRRDVNQN